MYVCMYGLWMYVMCQSQIDGYCSETVWVMVTISSHTIGPVQLFTVLKNTEVASWCSRAL